MADKEGTVSIREGRGYLSTWSVKDNIVPMPLKIGKTTDGRMLIDISEGLDFAIALPGGQVAEISIKLSDPVVVEPKPKKKKKKVEPKKKKKKRSIWSRD